MKNLLPAFLLVLSNLCFGQLNLQWQELGPESFGADVRALIIDKRDTSGQTLYAGTMGGGIWKSTNGGDWWSNLGCMENFSVSCMAQAANGIIYVGTGELLLNYSNAQEYGNGIFLIDSLDIITHLDSTSSYSAISPWSLVNRIATNPVNAQHLLAATAGGLLQTFDGGMHWSMAPLPPGISGAAIDAKWSADSIVMAVVGVNKILVVSKNYGVSWSRISATNNPGFPPVQGRIEVALAPSNSQVAYVSIATTSGATYGILKTANAGLSWDTVSRKNGSFNPCGPNNECWIDNALSVMTYDSSKIISAACAAYCISGQSSPVSLSPFINTLLAPSNDMLVYGIINDLRHPNVVYAYGHKGLFKCTNAQTGYPNLVFEAKHNGIRARDFTGVAVSPNGNIYGSSHFIGTLKYTPQTQAFTQLTGMSAACEVSRLDPKFVFVEDWCGQLRTSLDSGQTFFYKPDLNLDPQAQGDPSRCGNMLNANAPYLAELKLMETLRAYNSVDSVVFTAPVAFSMGDTIYVSSNTAGKMFAYVTPVSLNAGDVLRVPDAVQSRLFLSTNCGIWMKRHALDTALTGDWYRIAANFTGSATSFDFSADGDVLYAGTNTGKVVKVSGLNRLRDTPNWINEDSLTTTVFQLPQIFAEVDGIAVDKANADVVIAVLRPYQSTADSCVFTTSNGGLNWNLIQLGMPNNPVYDCVIDENNSNNYILATENGIWTSSNAGQSFVRDNGIMCEVTVSSLRQGKLLTDGCPVLYAATDALGIWRTFTLTPAGCDISLDLKEANNIGNAGFEVFPNPADGLVTLRLKGNSISTIFIIDLQGRVVSTLKNVKDTATINTTQLANGMYIATGIINGKRMATRFIVNH